MYKDDMGIILVFIFLIIVVIMCALIRLFELGVVY